MEKIISNQPPSVLLSVTDLKGGGSGGACTERSCNELNGPSDDDNILLQSQYLAAWAYLTLSFVPLT